LIGVPTARIVPSEEAVLGAMGVPPGGEREERVERLVEDAMAELRGTSRPRGVIAGVTADEFEAIYEGEGDNDVPSPLAKIFPKAESLVLFAVTLGAPLSDRITALLDEGSLALAVTLDAAAAEATELAGVHLDHTMLRMAREARLADDRSRALRYSPGYCGWNLTGQRALFATLEPGEIGISLTSACLMEPLKSISGIIVIGPPEIHEFEDDFPFCAACGTHDCRRRIAGLRA
jgi:hypothetical protein